MSGVENSHALEPNLVNECESSSFLSVPSGTTPSFAEASRLRPGASRDTSTTGCTVDSASGVTSVCCDDMPDDHSGFRVHMNSMSLWPMVAPGGGCRALRAPCGASGTMSLCRVPCVRVPRFCSKHEQRGGGVRNS
eukprot:4494948-Prymnesium_polylepis.1